jgi:hypothetical protein
LLQPCGGLAQSKNQYIHVRIPPGFKVFRLKVMLLQETDITCLVCVFWFRKEQIVLFLKTKIKKRQKVIFTVPMYILGLPDGMFSNQKSKFGKL